MKQTTPQTTESDAKLLAFSTILGGLLASGHFSIIIDDDGTPDLVRIDYGENWEECRPHISRRFYAEVLFVANELYQESIRHTSLNELNQ